MMDCIVEITYTANTILVIMTLHVYTISNPHDNHKCKATIWYLKIQPSSMFFLPNLLH